VPPMEYERLLCAHEAPPYPCMFTSIQERRKDAPARTRTLRVIRIRHAEGTAQRMKHIAEISSEGFVNIPERIDGHQQGKDGYADPYKGGERIRDNMASARPAISPVSSRIHVLPAQPMPSSR